MGKGEGVGGEGGTGLTWPIVVVVNPPAPSFTHWPCRH